MGKAIGDSIPRLSPWGRSGSPLPKIFADDSQLPRAVQCKPAWHKPEPAKAQLGLTDMQDATRDMIREAIRLTREAHEQQARADKMGENWEGWELAVRQVSRLLDEAAALYGQMK